MGDDYRGDVTVEAGDGTSHVLDYDSWSQSDTIVEMVKDGDPDAPTIPLASVDAEALGQVVEYMEMAKGTSETYKQQWIDTYKQSFSDKETLEDLVMMINASDYMGVSALLDNLCDKLADIIIKLNNPTAVAEHFDIRTDVTHAEELALNQTFKMTPDHGMTAMD